MKSICYFLFLLGFLITTVNTCDCGNEKLQIVNISPIILNDTFVESESLMLNRTNQWFKNETQKIKCLIDRNVYYVPISMKSYTQNSNNIDYDSQQLDQLPTAWRQYYDDDSEQQTNQHRSRHSLIHVIVYKFWLCTYNDSILSNPNINPGYTTHDDIIEIAFNSGSMIVINWNYLLVFTFFISLLINEK